MDIERFITGLHDYLEKALRPLAERVTALEERGDFATAYQGTYDPERSYERGQVVTHGGALWLVLRAVQGEKPGPSPAYRLILKSGGR